VPHLNSLNEYEVEAWKVRLTSALLDLQQDRVPFIEGVRRVLAIADEPRERAKDFDLFVAIDSETDHLPADRVRQQCSAEWLATCDREAKEARLFYREALQHSIDQLLAKLRSI
jgi:hypothetical protein